MCKSPTPVCSEPLSSMELLRPAAEIQTELNRHTSAELGGPDPAPGGPELSWESLDATMACRLSPRTHEEVFERVEHGRLIGDPATYCARQNRAVRSISQRSRGKVNVA